jgi:serine/threonine-protein kinase
MKLPVPQRRLSPANASAEIVITYEPMAEGERWLKQRLAEKSTKKFLFIWICIALFFLLGGPATVLWFLTAVTSLLTGSTLPSNATLISMGASNLYSVLYLLLGTGAIGATAIGYRMCQPTHLSITGQGITLIYSRIHLEKFVSWDKVSRLSLNKATGKTSPLENSVYVHDGDITPLKLRLGNIPTVEERSKFLEGIERWAPAVPRDAEVVQALELPADHSYTELWLQALAAPPKREKLQPLIENASLQVGRYIVTGKLGVGGQGTAYLAQDNEHGDTVVLKEFILPVYVDINVRKKSLEKFQHEARILQQMDHEQIVKLRDFFVEDHRGYLVLEHIDGMSLREVVIAEGALSEGRVAELALQMCTMLSYLHSLTPPVVHRDFTPDNLILRKDGTLKLVDFNVAQQTESTQTGTVVGKHAYLPPEQFRGQPEPRSDIYAMGATLFYLLTGSDPEPISTSHPREAKPEISVEMNYLVQRTTNLDPGLRYDTAGDLRIELEHLPKSTSISA